MEETGSKQNGWKERQATEKRGDTIETLEEGNEDIEETYILTQTQISSSHLCEMRWE